jgi:hypothetical protein
VFDGREYKVLWVADTAALFLGMYRTLGFFFSFKRIPVCRIWLNYGSILHLNM